MRNLILFIVLTLTLTISNAQMGWQTNDVRKGANIPTAYIHANIYQDSYHILFNSTVLIENGKILACGKNITIPQGYRIIDVKGKYIMPSFIDLNAELGVKYNVKYPGKPPAMNSRKTGPWSWNEAIHPEFRAASVYTFDEKLALDYKKSGFGLVLSHAHDGIFRGTGVLISLFQGNENNTCIWGDAATFYSFNKGSSSQDYPSSLMGSIALFRQTLLDAAWYNENKTGPADLSIEAFLDYKKLSMFFETENVNDIERARRISDENGLSFIYLSKGDEYKNPYGFSGYKFVIPLVFPKPIQISDENSWDDIPYTALVEWQQAPYNPATLINSKNKVAFTYRGQGSSNDFFSHIRKALLYGVSARQALASLTEIPAEMVGISNQVGFIKPGYQSEFIITSDSFGSADFEVLSVITSHGTESLIQVDFPEIRGMYLIPGQADTLKIRGTWSELTSTLGKTHSKVNSYMGGYKIQSPLFHIYITDIQSDDLHFEYTFFDSVGQELYRGNSSIPRMELRAVKPAERKISDRIRLFPFAAFSDTVDIYKQKPGSFLLKNSTLWTASELGKLIENDIHISNGKIIAIGKNLNVAGAIIIDMTGKHISPGIIDEHSHIAIQHGVNEGTQSVTSEVRIGDVIFPQDVNIYRQLAGGVTSSHLLHGSANCIGGQTQLIKLRWGKNADELKFTPWPGFIKFALGENVKQSNWGDNNIYRFPQTRMGVEQVILDAFIRAHTYRTQKENWNKNKGAQPRPDLELEALVEILHGERFITCHSYVQSEINMLMHVADSMKFKVNTFTHILEGYKVADKLRKHGASASTFADWWAYKYEVMEAIPYNAFLLVKAGVNTSVNSDDAEMARRLNQEAAKSIKYGNLDDNSCLRLCTANPAEMLHIDKFTGRILPGMTADLAVWSGPPLSVYARCEMTIVDGYILFSNDRNSYLTERMKQHRKTIIDEMKKAVQAGEMPIKPGKTEPRTTYNCREGE